MKELLRALAIKTFIAGSVAGAAVIGPMILMVNPSVHSAFCGSVT